MSKTAFTPGTNYVRADPDDIAGAVAALAHLRMSQDPIVRHYLLAGKHIAVEFFTPTLLASMAPALAHRESAAGPAELTVAVWDGVQEARPHTPAGNSWRGVYLHGEETLNLYDQGASVACLWTADAASLPLWVRAAPLRTILHWFLAESGIYLLHGAAIGTQGRAVLVAAKGGSGKSTTALASVLAGLDYLGDDYVAVEAGARPVCHSLYNSLKVTQDTLAAFPELATLQPLMPDTNDKAAFFIHELYPKQLRAQAELAAIFIPRIGPHARSHVTPARKSEALAALAPTTLFQLPLGESGTFAALRDLVSQTPCYTLHLGSDLYSAPEAIRNFLDSAPSI